MKALKAVQCLRRRICRYLGGLRRGLVPTVFIEVARMDSWLSKPLRQTGTSGSLGRGDRFEALASTPGLD